MGAAWSLFSHHGAVRLTTKSGVTDPHACNSFAAALLPVVGVVYLAAVEMPLTLCNSRPYQTSFRNTSRDLAGGLEIGRGAVRPTNLLLLPDTPLGLPKAGRVMMIRP